MRVLLWTIPFFLSVEDLMAKVVSMCPRELIQVGPTPSFNLLCSWYIAKRALIPIVLSVATLQRRHDLIGLDADVFNPDRWQDWKPQTWEFIPFNRGPRICLGRNFAYMQMEYVLCRLFQVFRAVKLEQDDVSDTADAGMKIKVALNTKPANPVMIRFYK
jgi:hypothetical protein